MRSFARSWVLVLIAAVVVCLVPATAGAAPGILKFESLTCTENEEIGHPKECSATKPEQFFKQAGGHPPFGITDFTLNAEEFVLAGGGVKSVRTDLPVGFSTNPEALSRCSRADFEANLDKPEENHCPASSQSGEQEVLVLLPAPTLLKGKVYSLVPKQGLGLEFGIDLALPGPGEPFFGIHVHSDLEGFVSWHKEKEAEEEHIESGDYHEFFKINTPKSLAEGEAPLVRSRLVTFGNLGNGLLTNPTTCPGPQLTHLRVETYDGKVETKEYASTASSGEERCDLLAPFVPAFAVENSPTTRDEGTSLTTDLSFSLDNSGSETEPSDLKTAVVTLPEGFTINPAAGHGLEACTPEQLNVAELEPACPERSVIGRAVISVPGLPPETLTGKIYLGADETPITKPPYKIYVAVNSKRYGQVIRMAGSVVPNLATGQLTTTFENLPQGPFNDTKLTFNGGVFADLANPLECGASKVNSTFEPYGAPGERVTIEPELSVTGPGCPGAAPFSPSQSLAAEPATGGGSSTVSFNLARPDGQQYLRTVKTVLPPGLLGLIPTVTQCPEPQAAKGECPASSQIGTAAVTAGAGANPFEFKGNVYLTGPNEGSPFGLTIVTPVVAGPFNFGNEVTRAKIDVDQHTAQVTVSATLPTIKQGIPVRLRSINVTVNRQGFERNPTNCAPLTVSSSLSSVSGALASVSSPFQVENCSALAFSPSFGATSSAKTSRLNGARLETTLKMPAGGANVKTVKVTLPKQLPSRLTTLQKACTEATFAANPLSCPAASQVGTVSAVTPTLPGTMTGPAYLVSHGGAAFPDLDLILEGSGVRVILVGNTDIKKGITHTTFAATPDVPVSSITVKLPTGPKSALAAFGDLCRNPLNMPTEITGQNGKVFKKNVRINVTDCGVKIVGKKVIRGTAYITVKTFGKGRITGSGSGVSRRSRTFSKAQNTALLKLPLSAGARSRHKVKVKVTFKSKQKGVRSSSTTATVRF